MDGVIDMEMARSLVGNATLWPRVRDFLWDFAPQVHGSWLEDLGRETLDMSSPRVKKFILDSLGVGPCFHDFQKDDGSRLLLLDGATLEKIAQWLGALACAEELRRVTDGATVRALKAALPGVYPEVFGYTEYFRKLKVERLKAEKLTPQSVLATGVESLFFFVSRLPQPLSGRLALKLPRDLSTINHSTIPLFNFSTLQLLMKLRFPEAYSLCCS